MPKKTVHVKASKTGRKAHDRTIETSGEKAPTPNISASKPKVGEVLETSQSPQTDTASAYDKFATDSDLADRRKEKLVDAVIAHAEQHYNDGGWDVVVETWDRETVADTVGKATTVAGAIKAVSSIVDVYADKQADARISSGYDTEADRVADMKEAQYGDFEQLPPEELCEHGLSAWLCEGPMHYPQDNPY